MRSAIVLAQSGMGVLVVGYALFRFLISRSISRVSSVDERRMLGAGLRAFSWPSSRAGLSLGGLGWLFTATFLSLMAARAAAGAPSVGETQALALAGVLLGAHAALVANPGPRRSAVFGITAVVASTWSIAARPLGEVYSWILVLHVGVTLLWLGHMFFWSVFAGPGLKRLEDRDLGARLRRLSLSGPGLGWPALGVLVPSGVYMLAARGVGFGDLFSPAFLAHRFGWALDVKLALVVVMLGYQVVFGHREAPRAVLVNMGVAVLVLALATLLTGV